MPALERPGERVLVTGATGFLGANLVRALLPTGTSVHVLARSGSDRWRLSDVQDALSWHAADVVDREAVQRAVRQAQPEVVFHLAAAGGHPRSEREREHMRRGCVEGTATVLDATRHLAGCRFVHVASSLEYGPGEGQAREDAPMAPLSARGRAKAAATLLCRQEAQASGRPIVLVRPFSVYGPWESPARLVPAALLAALGGHGLPLHDGASRRDFVYVDDVVEGCLRAATVDLPPGEIVNLGTGVARTNAEMVEAVSAATGRPVHWQPMHAGTAAEADVRIADTHRARQRLDWSPRGAAEGLAAFASWIRAHHHEYAARASAAAGWSAHAG